MRAALLMLLLWSSSAAAHRPSDAYLTLDVQGSVITGHWEIALRDVAVLVDLDTDRNRELSWGELRTARPQIETLLAGQLALRGDGAICPLRFTDLLIHDRSDNRYAWFGLHAQCPNAPRELSTDYRLLFDVDPTHRGLLVLRAGTQTHSAVLGPDPASRHFDLAASSALTAFLDYLREGVWHIWIGLDHVLFLLALLLPAVLVYERGHWQPCPRLAPALWNVTAIVTAFTLAHSITLTLAALEWVRLPARWVESAIALTVLLAALNNLRPVVLRLRWALAFGLGLIHGFGFASVLGALGLPPGLQLTGLVAFNLGVELGQLAIVFVAVPLAYALRASAFYRTGLRVFGSLTVALLAAWWLLERLEFVQV